MAEDADEYYVNGVRLRGRPGTLAVDGSGPPVAVRLDVEGMRAQADTWGFADEEFRALVAADRAAARGEPVTDKGGAMQARRATREQAWRAALVDDEAGGTGLTREAVGDALATAERTKRVTGIVANGEDVRRLEWMEAERDGAPPRTPEERATAERRREYVSSLGRRADEAVRTQVDRLITIDTGRSARERSEDRMSVVRTVVEPLKKLPDLEVRLAETERVMGWRREMLAEARREEDSARLAVEREGDRPSVAARTRWERARERVAGDFYLLEELAFVRGDTRSAIAARAAEQAMARGAQRAAAGAPGAAARGDDPVVVDVVVDAGPAGAAPVGTRTARTDRAAEHARPLGIGR